MFFTSPCFNCTKAYLKGHRHLKVKAKSYHDQIYENSIFLYFKHFCDLCKHDEKSTTHDIYVNE